jgi:RNA polymerase sigma-70 factor (ECF subfamily)
MRSDIRAPEPTVTGFEDFYASQRSRIARAVVLAAGGRDLGMEATDEAFTRALARWSEVSTYANPSGWVYRVAINWARSRMR